MSDVTRILSKIEAGERQASKDLLPLVYDELRKLAAARMANERVDHTLQSTAIVHEAYLKLVDEDSVKHWDSRGHFFAAAAEAMRRILVDYARSKVFAGLSVTEAAKVIRVSRTVAYEYWDFALAWFAAEEPV